MIKLYSNLTDYLNQQLVLEKENPDQTYLLELNYKIQVYSVYKNFFIGLFYLTHKKLEELYTIMHHVQEGLEEAKKYYTNNKLKQNNSTSLNRCSEQATNIKSLIEFVLAQTFVRMSEENKLKQSNVNMELDGNNKKGKLIFYNVIRFETTYKMSFMALRHLNQSKKCYKRRKL